MGKTLQKQKKKAQLGLQPGQMQKHQQQAGDKKSRRRRKEPKQDSALTNHVSAAFASRDWDGVVQALETMRRAGFVPKLGAVQRWVRLADMVGDPAQMARLLSAILRAVPGGGPIAHADSDALRACVKEANGIRFYPNWTPPMSPHQQLWVQSKPKAAAEPSPSAPSPASASAAAAAQPEAHDPPPAPAAPAPTSQPESAEAGPSASQATPSTSTAPRFSLVVQDESMQPAKRPGFKELKIYALEPHTIRFGPDPMAVRHDVPFVPGAFVLSGLLSPDECRQLIEASEAIGYSWDVDYTFNPSSPADSAASLDPEQEQQNNSGQGWQQSGKMEDGSSSGQQSCMQQQQEQQQQQQQSECSQGVSHEQDQKENSLAHHEQCVDGGPGRPSKKQRGEHAQQQSEGGQQQQQQQDKQQQKQGKQQQQQQQQQKEQKKGGKKQKGQGAQAQHQQQPQQPQDKKQQSSQPQQHPLLSAARAAAGGDRAAGCVLLADDSIMGPLVRRMSALMPQVLCGGKLAGLNCRLRLYRYNSGNVYRPHVDGAWPGSGIKDGKMVHDAYGDRWSRLTFLMYLNDDFEGGATTFFTPAPDNASLLQARGVTPRTGNILCFAHGDTQNSLVHEGSAVTSGKKYVIRTDVLYTLSLST